jgi:Calcineurin-like phosphoesterase
MTDDIETFRDHFLSVYQSAVSDVATRIDQRAASSGTRLRRRSLSRSASSVLPGVAADIARRDYAESRGLIIAPAGPADRTLTAGDVSRVCAELAFRYLKARIGGDAAGLAEVEGEFRASTCDPAWATTIEEYVQYFGPSGGRRQIPYIRAATVGAKTIELKANARVAIVGDWGTGAQPAVTILTQIAASKPDVFIHLGDIYYSGTPAECASNFASLIESVLRTANPNLAAYTLAGNHDMYCGGVGYYDLIQRLNPEPFCQPASFFCLRSADERWQILAMDTGLHDYNPLGVNDAVTFLEDDELEWHCARLKEFPGRTILLSHHQLFSAFSPIGKPDEYGVRSAVNPRLLRAFTSMVAAGSISAWFWGHEHTLSVYEAFAGLRRGRCLGHGAVPVSIRENIYEPLSALAQIPATEAKAQLARQGTVYAHGYATLAFGTDTCRADYYQDLNGKSNLLFSEWLD